MHEISPLERVIRPIVEGQIRGFLKEHPKVLEGVDWYKPRENKEITFVNSLAKRIVRDLVCGSSSARLREALLEPKPESASEPASGRIAAAAGTTGVEPLTAPVVYDDPLSWSGNPLMDPLG